MARMAMRIPGQDGADDTGRACNNDPGIYNFVSNLQISISVDQT